MLSQYTPLNNRAIIVPEKDTFVEDSIFESVRSRFTKAKLIFYSTYNENTIKEIGDCNLVKSVVVETHLIEKIDINNTVIYTVPINAIVLIEK
jgi:hypothetical protein